MGFLDFNAEEEEPNKAFEPIPAGDYQGKIVGSEVKATASGSGQYLKIEIEVLGPSCAGRKVFDHLNIQNDSPEAERIGRAQLSALCHAIGVLRVSDSNQLHEKPFAFKVAIEKDATGQYGDKNKVKGYKKIEGAIPAFPAASSPATSVQPANPGSPPAAPAAASAPPWLRGKTA